MLDNKISKLLSSSKLSLPFLKDQLVLVQTLLIYQIIRLFDGDVRQRAYAERHFAILEEWTQRLQIACVEYESDQDPSQTQYYRWILIESARRTSLMSLMVHGIYCLLRDGVCTTVPKMAFLPMSMNGALWNMSEEDWWLKTHGRGSDLLTYQEFVVGWSDGTPYEIDAFETIMLAACKHKITDNSFKAS